MRKSLAVTILDGLEHLVEVETADALDEGSDEGKIFSEIATFKYLHNNVRDFYFAAVSLHLFPVNFKLDALNDVCVCRFS